MYNFVRTHVHLRKDHCLLSKKNHPPVLSTIGAGDDHVPHCDTSCLRKYVLYTSTRTNLSCAKRDSVVSCRPVILVLLQCMVLYIFQPCSQTKENLLEKPHSYVNLHVNSSSRDLEERGRKQEQETDLRPRHDPGLQKGGGGGGDQAQGGRAHAGGAGRAENGEGGGRSLTSGRISPRVFFSRLPRGTRERRVSWPRSARRGRRRRARRARRRRTRT